MKLQRRIAIDMLPVQVRHEQQQCKQARRIGLPVPEQFKIGETGKQHDQYRMILSVKHQCYHQPYKQGV